MVTSTLHRTLDSTISSRMDLQSVSLSYHITQVQYTGTEQTCFSYTTISITIPTSDIGMFGYINAN